MSIQSELTRLTNAKAAIKAAIEGKGVTVPEGTLLDGMAALIESIEAGGGDIIVGTFTLTEDAQNVVLQDIKHPGTVQYFLAIFYDNDSGTITSGHFRIGMDIGATRVSRFYSSTMDGYSPQLQDGTDKIFLSGGKFQAGIIYRYIFAKELW